MAFNSYNSICYINSIYTAPNKRKKPCWHFRRLVVSVQLFARVAELVDATDLDDLSALAEMLNVELPKFGERFQRTLMPIPSQAEAIRKV
jgi:hypothetical protein